MSNFRIDFTNPWLLLLLIPAIALTLLPYFRIRKQYRRNRNRVVSIVLHSLVMLLCISLLAGLTFSYEIPNRENEILLLVDASYSNREETDKKDEFIETVVEDCGNAYKLGIIKFGYDQLYVAELSTDTRNVYAKYVASEDPDTSATDIAAALTYASEQFTNPQAGKIVLISDGIETDETAVSVIRAIASTGIKVDVMHFPNTEINSEVQIMSVETPSYNVKTQEKFKLKVNVKNNLGTETKPDVAVTLYDNDTKLEPVNFTLNAEEQTLELEHSFESAGLHKLRFEISSSGGNGYQDTIEHNNSYYSYYYLNVFNKVLILEKDKDESQELRDFLKEQEYDVTVISTEAEFAQIPNSLTGLCDYDQIILVNVAYTDMPGGFDEILYEYVHELGGGLFTVGGNYDTVDGKIIPHMYNREDMAQSQYYSQMLPVQVVDYTPPVAVMIVIDHSGSMGSGENSALAQAKKGALSCLDVLKSGDYCGVMTFDNNYSEEIEVTPVSKRKEIRDKINKIDNDGAGGTLFSFAIDRAGAALTAVSVEKRHIIMITDGQPGDTLEDFGKLIDINRSNGITMSIVTTQTSGFDAALLKEITEIRGGGKLYSDGNIAQNVYDDLVSEAITEIKYGEEFLLRISERTPVVEGIRQEELNEIPFKGYYGTLLKNGAVAPLYAEYVPMYAQWDFGKGKVGSFMCDLNGTWSGEFLKKPVGQKFINNVISGLFPLEEIKIPEINVSFKDDNYTTQLNVFTKLGEGDTVEIKITPLTAKAIDYYSDKNFSILVSDGYTRFTFSLYCDGVYSIDVIKKSSSGEILSQRSLYKTFSYSEEYDYFPEEEIDGAELLALLAKNGRGVVLEDSLQIFESFTKTINKTVDPRLAFLIIAIILFLLDVAVRKFKFKWPHEIIREYKAKKELENEKS